MNQPESKTVIFHFLKKFGLRYLIISERFARIMGDRTKRKFKFP